ncbi:MAG: glycosyltransferase [Frondihabitans sp.]|nr:glycosyltransferase [Frondihabitans sp.]
MKIALVTSEEPFVLGGARNIVEWLDRALTEAGHETELISLPFEEAPDDVLAQTARFRMIDLSGSADLVVCFRPPSYLVRHPRKVVWFIHHLRTYYDLWDTPLRGFPDTVVTRKRRDIIRRADDRALAEAHHVFTNSKVVSERLLSFNGVPSDVLYPPLSDTAGFANSGYGDTIVAVSRLENHKRQKLLVQALGLTTTDVRLRLIGRGATPTVAEDLRSLAADLGVADRLDLDDTWMEEEEKRRLIGAALACAYLPVDEDSYGYPTLEAAHSAKAVLTTGDSGGVLEFVEHDVSGIIAEPDAGSLAQSMDRLHRDRPLAERLGQGAVRRVSELDISWSHVVERIVTA